MSKVLTSKEIAEQYTMLIIEPEETEREINKLIEFKCKEQREICAKSCKMKSKNDIWTPDYDSIRNAPSPIERD